MWGEQSVRSGGDGSGVRNNNNGDNDDIGNIGDNGEDKDDGGGGRRGSGKCNDNVGSVESGMRRGGKRLTPIPAALSNSE